MVAAPPLAESLDALKERHESARLALEIQHLERALTPRLVESWGEIIDPRLRNSDPDFGGYNSARQITATSLNDRKDGAFLPVYQSEQDLAYQRAASRNLITCTGIRTGILNSLTDYVLCPGFTFKAAPPDGTQGDKNLTVAVQRFIDELLDENDFIGDLDREIHCRSREDGDAFVSLHERPGGKVKLRISEPDQITQPADPRDLEEWIGCHEKYPSSWSFGVHTREGHTDEPLGYHVVYDGVGNDWDYVPVSRMQHIRRNVTRNAKRGVSDFYEVVNDLVGEVKLRRGMVTGASLQAAVAWILKPPTGSTNAQVTSLVNAASTAYREYEKQTAAGSTTQYIKRYKDGTILGTAPGQEYAEMPGHDRNEGFQIVGQYALRAIGVRWNMPEYLISGDASNANYASSLVAESPFVKARESDQQFYRRHFLSLVWKALRIAFEAGRFSRHVASFADLLSLIDIKCDLPTVATRDPLKIAETQEAQIRMGILSPRTAATQAGLDYDAEVKEGAKAAEPVSPYPQFGLPAPANTKTAAVEAALESVHTIEEAKAVLKQLREVA